MPPRYIAIGDVHGCSKALRSLIAAIHPRPDDTIIPLGDCIDRGPDSRGVMEELLALRENCRLMPILGNHEEMMLSFLEGRPQPDNWLLCGGDETLQSYGGEVSGQIPIEHIDYIRTWQNYFETSTHFFAHAAYHPEQPLAEQRWQNWRWHTLRDTVPDPHKSGRVAVVGHTSQKDGEILDVGHLVCIDTYCWGGGWLTALDVTTGQVWQADRNGGVRN